MKDTQADPTYIKTAKEFTLKDFYRIKKMISDDLFGQYETQIKLYDGPGFNDMEHFNKALMTVGTSSIRIDKGEMNEDALTKLYMAAEANSIERLGAVTELRGITKDIGRYDMFDYVVFKTTWYEPMRDGVPTQVIKKYVKAHLNKMFMPPERSEYNFTLECKLMEQFKLGNITMYDVVLGSLDGCDV